MIVFSGTLCFIYNRRHLGMVAAIARVAKTANAGRGVPGAKLRVTVAQIQFP